MQPRILIVCATPEALATRAADEFASCCGAAVKERGRFSAALSGGKTPRAMLSALSSRPIDWRAVHLFWSDERCVPPGDPDSNYKMAYDALVSRVPIPPENVHRIKGEMDPQDAARGYRLELESYFGGKTPAFDVIFLGMGLDGHTASLFPGSAALEASDEICVATRAPAGVAAPWRVTLTYTGIAAARRIIMLVEGADKAVILAEVLEGGNEPNRYPARDVYTAAGEFYCLVDAAAAAKLRRTRTEI